MAKPLKDISVLNTRPAGQNAELTYALESLGAEVYEFPTIEIQSNEPKNLKSVIEKLDSFAGIIFTSINAVTHSLALFDKNNVEIPENVKIIAVGASTQEALHAQQIVCDICPIKHYSTEALLKMSFFDDISGQDFLIITGKNPRPVLKEALKEKGATTTQLFVYERKVPNYAASAIMDLTEKNFDFVVCTSNNSLKNLHAILEGKLGEKALAFIENSQLIGYSERINTLAKKLKFTKQPLIAAPASTATITDLIKGTSNMVEKKAKSEAKKEVISDKQKSTPPVKNKSLSVQTLLCIVAIVISVIALIEGAYIVTKSQHLNKSEKVDIVKLKTHISDQKQTIAANSSQLSTLQQSLKAQSETINANEAALQNFAEIKSMNNTAWKLAEIKYLLNLAQFNLTLAHNPTTATAILKQVNREFSHLNNSGTLALQQQIVDVLTQLNSLPKIDYANTLMQLNAISKQLTTLPLVSASMKSKTPTDVKDSTEEKGWHKYWDKTLSALEKVVIVQHQDQVVEPLITPKQQHFLVENIQLKLAEASWALLHKNQAVYQAALQEAITWISKYYAPGASSTTSILKTLKQLQQINLQPKLPNLDNVINSVDGLLNSQTQKVKEKTSSVVIKDKK